MHTLVHALVLVKNSNILHSDVMQSMMLFRSLLEFNYLINHLRDKLPSNHDYYHGLWLNDWTTRPSMTRRALHISLSIQCLRVMVSSRRVEPSDFMSMFAR